jgi:hypothetical protein
MLILSYFDRIIGPRLFLTFPENLCEELGEDYLRQVSDLLDAPEDDGFFTHNFSPELKTANWMFSMPSNWARGRIELLMVSVLISEEEPDYARYEKIFSKFVERISNHPNMFKSLYVTSGPKTELEEINEKFEVLKEELYKIYKILSIRKVETEGQLISFSSLKEDKKIRLSGDIIHKLGNLNEEKKNFFIVFRTRGKAMKLDVIPVSTEKIIRLAIIFGEQVQLPVLHQIGQILARYDNEVSLIFTSGLCVEVEKCIYEVYIDTEMPTLNKIIEEIYKIKSILEIEVKLIALKK